MLIRCAKSLASLAILHNGQWFSQLALPLAPLATSYNCGISKILRKLCYNFFRTSDMRGRYPKCRFAPFWITPRPPVSLGFGLNEINKTKQKSETPLRITRTLRLCPNSDFVGTSQSGGALYEIIIIYLLLTNHIWQTNPHLKAGKLFGLSLQK